MADSIEITGIKGDYRFAHDGELNGTAKISLYVGDKFKANDVLTLYYYNLIEKQLDLLNSNISDAEAGKIWNEALEGYDVLVDKDGYITIELTYCSDYLLVDTIAKKKIVDDAQTKDKEENKNDKVKEDKKNNNIIYIVIAGGIIITTIVIVICVITKKKNSKYDKVVIPANTVAMENEDNVQEMEMKEDK